MSHSGSSEYPIPLTGPTSTSVLSSSQLTHAQHTIQRRNSGIKSSTKSILSSLSKDGLKDSLEIYSVHTHQRRKKHSSSADANNKSTINNNYNTAKVYSIPIIY